jgi:hypothetical protein
MILDHFCSDKKASPYRQIVRVQKKGGDIRVQVRDN